MKTGLSSGCKLDVRMYVIWLFVGISSVLVSQTTSQRWTNVPCYDPSTVCPSKSFCRWQWSNSEYYCLCSVGYTWRGGQCRDRNECFSSHRCHQNAVCTNTQGSYYCTCKSGYAWNGQTCTDIDECSNYRPCHRSAACQNYPGGYNCTCLGGFSGNGIVCTDIDECSNSSPCHRSAVCYNYPGDYNCTCLTGYSGNGTICTDTDECSDSSPCDRSAVCENYPRGYRCTCLTGYSGNGTICTYIDECSESNPCDMSAVCENYPGGYNCTCLTGYTVNGANCTDIDECSNSSVCDTAAVCENYPGGYNCTCITGYSGNGTFCTDTLVTGLAALAASPGAISGVVIGACAVLIAVIVVVLILIRRKRKEKSVVEVPKSPPQPQYENVQLSSGASTTGNTAAVVSPDVDGSRDELYHNNLIKERKKIQLNQTLDISDDSLDINTTTGITYSDDNIGECGGSHYDKLWETKIEQPSPNFTAERSNAAVQISEPTDVQISKGAEVYGYDHFKRGASQPVDNTGDDREGVAYGHLYGADIDSWDTENTDIDEEQSNTNNVYSLAKDVDRD